MKGKPTKEMESAGSFDASSARSFKIRTTDAIPQKVLTAPVPVIYLNSSETLKYPQPSWSLGIWDMANSYTTDWYNKCRHSFEEFQELGFELFTGTIRVDDKFRKKIGNADFAIALVPVKEGKHQTGKQALNKYLKYLKLLMKTPGAIAMGLAVVTDLGLFPQVRLAGKNSIYYEPSKKMLNFSSRQWKKFHKGQRDKNDPYLSCETRVFNVAGMESIMLRINLDAPAEEAEDLGGLVSFLDRGLSDNEVLNQRTAASLVHRLLFTFCLDFCTDREVKTPVFVFWRPMPGSQNRVWELFFTPKTRMVELFVATYHGICCYTGINFEGDGMWIGKKIPENVPEPLCRYDGKKITLYNFEHHKVDDLFLHMGDEVEIPEYQSVNASTRPDGDVPMDASRYTNQAWVDG